MRRVPLALLLVACGARTGLDVVGSSPAPKPDAGMPSPMCVAAPQPTTLVSLEGPTVEGGASYAFTGDASRLYTFVWQHDSSTVTNVLSVDPCSGATVVIAGNTTYQSPLTTDGHGVYFQTSADQGQTFEVVRSDPLDQTSKVVAVLPEPITELTIAGGVGYAITESTALVALALDGSGPTTLVPVPTPNRVRVWWDGTVVDDAFVYFTGPTASRRCPRRAVRRRRSSPTPATRRAAAPSPRPPRCCWPTPRTST